MKVLVTGGAGFIGSHLVDGLLAQGQTVAVVDNLSTGRREQVPPGAAFYPLDIRDPKIEEVFRKERPDAVSHHAAQVSVRESVRDPVFDADVNILGTLHLLEVCCAYGIRRFLFASSGGAVYGEQEVFPAPETHPTRPASPYGIGKRAVEDYLEYYRAAKGLSFAALRYGNVYGPRQDPNGEAGVVAIFSQRLLRGEPPVVNGDGEQTRDYLFVGDVVGAHRSVLDAGAEGVFNVGTGRETSVNALLDLLRPLTGAQVQEAHGPAKAGEQRRSVIDAGRLMGATDWAPRVSLEEGLEKTVEWFRNQMGNAK